MGGSKPRAPSAKPGKPKKTMEQLYAQARKQGIVGRSSMNKAQLERALASAARSKKPQAGGDGRCEVFKVNKDACIARKCRWTSLGGIGHCDEDSSDEDP